MTLKFTLLVSVLFFIIPADVIAHANDPDNSDAELKRSSIYGTAGTGIGGILTANIETRIWNSNDFFIKSLSLKAGGGIWQEFFGSTGTHYLAGLTGLTGRGNNHLEMNLGIGTRFERSFSSLSLKYRDTYPTALIGYRFQKPGGIMIFRTGFGWPETLYLSIGAAF